LRWRRRKRSTRPRPPSASPPPVPPKELPASPVPYRTVPPPYELSDQASPRWPVSISKTYLSMSPVTARSPAPGWRGDSDVLGAYRAVELEADLPSEASLRDRASPESASSRWTDRQARGGISPTPWI
jgi:hypothetical protein